MQWRPEFPVRSNRVMELNRFNPAKWSLTLPANYAEVSSPTIVFRNSYGQTLATWEGDVDGRVLTFDIEDDVDLIPRGAGWQLFADIDGTERLLVQGTVVRNEQPFPDAPVASPEWDAKMFSYSFGTPGRLYDPAWRILVGRPTVYDNSGEDLPNAVAAGTLFTLELWPQAVMMWFAPTQTDSVRFTYNVVRHGDGECRVMICSNYDATNWAGILHKQVFGIGSWDDDEIAIVTGTGPTDYQIRATVSWETQDLQNYTAEYNPLTDTYAVYLGDSLDPIVSWTDSTNIVDHGPGERYVGLGFKSALLSPGVEVSDWRVQDYV